MHSIDYEKEIERLNKIIKLKTEVIDDVSNELNVRVKRYMVLSMLSIFVSVWLIGYIWMS